LIGPLFVRAIAGVAVTPAETTTGTDVVNTAPPLVPVTVTTYVPAVVVEDVFSVRVVVAGESPVTDAELAIKQVGVEAAAEGVTTQLRATAPVNPPVGVTEMVDVPLAPGATLIGPLFVSVKYAFDPLLTATVAADGA
jgi:hypothetical protein